MKLHVGSGNKHLPGYENIDIRYLPGVDRVENVKFLRSFKESTIHEIYACHVLEHFTRWDYMTVISRWYQLLIKGGTLKIAVPDFEQIVTTYNKTKNLESIIGLLYGGQDYDENFHHIIWDFNTLKKDLESIGFVDIKRYDWRDTIHSNIDDYSQSYLPHLDKTNGTLMSLNIIALK